MYLLYDVISRQAKLEHLRGLSGSYDKTSSKKNSLVASGRLCADLSA